jgi:hypothetical protein
MEGFRIYRLPLRNPLLLLKQLNRVVCLNLGFGANGVEKDRIVQNKRLIKLSSCLNRYEKNDADQGNKHFLFSPLASDSYVDLVKIISISIPSIY